MGDISIIARRLSPEYVQYGWSGNGGYYKCVGDFLLNDYDTPEMVEYLFGLGQLSLLSEPYSEKKAHWFRNTPTGKPHWVGTTEREIFSKIMFIDYGYFFDSDSKWYYVVPGPFRIKMPLELVANNLDKDGYEFDYLSKKVGPQVVKKILSIYETNDELRKKLSDVGMDEGQVRKIVEECLSKGSGATYYLYDHSRKIFDQFDDWAVIRTDEDGSQITDVVMRLQEEKHEETINW